MEPPTPYQVDLVRWRLAELERTFSRQALLQWPTGTGKTRGFIMLAGAVAPILQRMDATRRYPTIWFFTVKAGKNQMLDQIRKWDERQLDALDILFVEGTEQERKMQIMAGGLLRPKWIILNHDQGKSELALVMKHLARGLDILLVDEVDVVQNMDSSMSKAFRALSPLAGYRIGGSAHTMPNRMDSAYGTYQWADPYGTHEVKELWVDGTCHKDVLFPQTCKTFGTLGDYLRQHANYDWRGKIVGIRNVPEFQQKLRQLGVHVVSKEEAGIHRAKPTLDKVGLYSEQGALYGLFKQGLLDQVDDLAAEWTRMYPEERQKQKFSILRQINSGRRICVLSTLAYKQAYAANVAERIRRELKAPMHELDPSRVEGSPRNAKADWVKRFVEQYAADVGGSGNGGFYVFCEWTAPLHEIKQAIGVDLWRRLNGRMLTGEHADGERELTRRMVEREECKLVLASGAGGRSLNLQTLNYVANVSPTWRHTELDQATGRVERIGQKNQTYAHYLLADNTIETKRIMPIMQEKGRTMEAAYSGKKGRREKTVLDFEFVQEISEWL